MERLRELGSLIVERVDNTSTLSNFYCGIKAMDDFIHDSKNGLLKYIQAHLTNLWIIRKNQETIALFSLSKNSVVINTWDKENLKMNAVDIVDDFFYTKSNYPSVEIDYLAIKEPYRKKGLGEYILALILAKVREDKLSATLFLSLDAYDSKEYSSVAFYKKCGFLINEYGLLINQNKVRNGEVPLTVRIFKPIWHVFEKH